MRTARFHAEAETEMLDAAAYYEAQREHLGERFLAAVQDALNRIQINPSLYEVTSWREIRFRKSLRVAGVIQ